MHELSGLESSIPIKNVFPSGLSIYILSHVTHCVKIIYDKGWYTFDVHFEGDLGLRQKWDVIGHRRVGGSACSGRRIFIFLIKENWICAMTRNPAKPNIIILLTRNFPFDSDVWLWSHPLMIPLHCLRAKSNNGTRV